MTIELLEKPITQVEEGTTCHVYAIDTIDDAQAPEESSVRESALPKAVGYVALAPSRMRRYMDNAKKPYMIHDTMLVKGMVGSKAVYDKTVSPKGFLGWPKPFYDLRVAIARRRASRRVLATLT